MENKATKKQHYVPQFYLRQWCDDDNCFYPIKVKSKAPPSLQIFQEKSNPTRFCYENFFYAQQTGVEDEVSQVIEKKFAEIEGVFSNVIPEIEKKILNLKQITETDKYHLAECMLFFHFKGKKYREESKHMTDKMMKSIYRFRMQHIDKIPKAKAEMEELGLTKEQMIEFAEKGDYKIDFGNIHHLRIMEDMEGFCNMLTVKYWQIYISREGHFITTDAPYRDVALSKQFWGNDFFAREQTFILSPYIVIIARDPKNLTGKNIHRTDITGNKGSIMTINCHNLMSSLLFGFHKNRSLLTEVEKTTTFLHDYYKLQKQG